MSRALPVAATLAGGGVLTAALFWALLNTPDSNVLMLSASALLTIACLAVAGVAVNAALLLAGREPQPLPQRSVLQRAVRGLGWFATMLLIYATCWWVLTSFDARVNERAGEINAWLMTQWGWTSIDGLLSAERWVSRWLRWAVLPSLAVTALAALLTPGLDSGWLRRAFAWRTLLTVTAVFLVLFVAPQWLVSWRPLLPPTWVQPSVAALRLAVAGAAMLAGGTAIVMLATRRAQRADP